MSEGTGSALADFPDAGLGLILLLASLVAMLCRRFDLPYSTGLVAAGIGLGVPPKQPQVPLSRDLILDVFPAPLVFEAALQSRWPALRR